MLYSWSHSRVVEFEKCKYRAYLLHDAKVPEPQRPLPPGKTEHANDRGTRIHEGCERFITGAAKDMPIEAKHFAEEMEALRKLHTLGCVSVEGEWAMGRDWQPWDWRGQWVEDPTGELTVTHVVKSLPEFGKIDQVVKVGRKVFAWIPAWLRLKLDCLVFVSEAEAIAIDFKSGKKFGNEIKHGEQLQLYQLVTFLRYPALEKVHTELWYLDVNDITSQSFTRNQGLRFQRSWDKRGNAVTTCTEFPPNANRFSCKWCEYGPWGTGHCQVGVRG